MPCSHAYVFQYYTNDWFHRIMLVIQLVTFGALSSFTKDFNPFNVAPDPHTVPAADYLCGFHYESYPTCTYVIRRAVNYARKCNLGISLLFAGARLCLVISYVRGPFITK